MTHSATYVFRQGYIRTTSSEYTLDSASICRPEVHLTNNAIQSQFKDYGKFEDGNIISMGDFQTYLTQTDASLSTCVAEKLVPDMHRQISLSVDAARKDLYLGKGFFEIFGYDFIVDDQLESWLIEVNTNPSIEESNGLLEKLVPRMINDALKLTVDQAFPPKKGQVAYDPSILNVFEVDGWENNENMWQMLTAVPLPQAPSKGNKKIFVP